MFHMISLCDCKAQLMLAKIMPENQIVDGNTLMGNR